MENKAVNDQRGEILPRLKSVSCANWRQPWLDAPPNWGLAKLFPVEPPVEELVQNDFFKKTRCRA